MRYRFYLLAACAVLYSALLGCKQDKTVPSPVSSPTANSQSTITVEAGFEFDEKEPWTELNQEQLADAHRDVAQLAIETKAPVSVVFLGERIRIYNVGGKWRPLTLTLLDDQKKPLRTSWRIDLPPSGVVRTKMPELTADDVAHLRLTQPTVKSNKQGEEFVLLDLKIGTPSEPFTSDSVAELGFVTVEKHTSSDGEAEPAVVSAYAQGEIDKDAVETVLGAGEDVRVKATRTESGVSSSTFANPTDTWRSIVIADKSSSFASSDGSKGKAPAEKWWVSTLGDVLELDKTMELNSNTAKASD